MMQRSIIEQAIADFGSICQIGLARDGSDARPVRMVIRQEGRGRPNVRSPITPLLDNDTMRRGATWGYGLILAEDAPEGMNAKTELRVADSLGRVWHSDAARSLADVNPEDGALVIAGWRLALWEKQEMGR